MTRTFDPQHISRLMLLGGTAVLLATLLYIVWFRHQAIGLSLADKLELRFGGMTLFGLTTVLLFDLFVFAYESIRALKKPTAKG